MAQFRWLDLVDGAAGLETPLLYLYCGPYAILDRNPESCPQVIMLIRGHKLPDRDSSIQLKRIGRPLVLLADCALHLVHRRSKVKAGPLPPNVLQYYLRGRRNWSSQDLAYSIYSRLLSPFSNAVVFFEDEHTSLASIMQILAHWVWLTPTGDYRPSLPRLLIFHRKRHRTINVEDEVAFQILEHFNHEKTLAFKNVKSAWKRCFGSITTIAQEVADFPLERLLHESEEVQHYKVSRQGALNARHFQQTFRAACAHFAQPWDKPVDLLEASRAAHPFPRDFPYHVEQLTGAMAKTPAAAEIAAYLVARALMLDYSAPQVHRFPPEEVFAYLYLPFLTKIQQKLAGQQLVSIVRSEFIKLTASCLGEAQELPEAVHVPQQLAPGSCLACLACTPSYTLTCGHRLCDDCAINAPQRCPLPVCATANETSICPKPAGAGIRILRLGGSIQDAYKIAGQLKEIRSRLFGHLKYSFDLVVCTGVGNFFAFMLLCTSASVEDCMWHLRRVGTVNIKVKRDSLSFGPGLKYPLSDLYRSPIKLVLCFNGKIIPSYETPNILPLPIDELAYQEKERFWPESRVDIFVKFPDICDQQSFDFIAGRWLALLFYVELDQDLVFYAGSPVVVRLVLKCRIPPGGMMNSLVRTLHQDRVRIYYGTDNDAPQSRRLCPRRVWRNVRDQGVTFVRKLQVKVQSPASIIDIKVQGLQGGSFSVSNCPRDVGGLRSALSFGVREMDQTKSIDTLEQELASLAIL